DVSASQGPRQGHRRRQAGTPATGRADGAGAGRAREAARKRPAAGRLGCLAQPDGYAANTLAQLGNLPRPGAPGDGFMEVLKQREKPSWIAPQPIYAKRCPRRGMFRPNRKKSSPERDWN